MNNSEVDQERLERLTARRFSSRFMRVKRVRCVKLDQTVASSQRKKPDFKCYDLKGHSIVLEITRWLPSSLRRFENYLSKQIAHPLDGKLQGTYSLVVDSQAFPSLHMGRQTVQAIHNSIHALISNNPSASNSNLLNGIAIKKVRYDGSRLIPWITRHDEPLSLTEASGEGKELYEELRKIFAEADKKFQGFSYPRILLLTGTAQNGVDPQLHCEDFQDGPGIVTRWCRELCHRYPNLDYVYLDPGVRVWKADDFAQVLTGTKYTEEWAGYFKLLWQSSAAR